MEQKQLDEIDESYFGEEFIEEEIVDSPRQNRESMSRTAKKEIKKGVATKKVKPKVVVSVGKKNVAPLEGKREVEQEKYSTSQKDDEGYVTITPVKQTAQKSPSEPTAKVVETSAPKNPWADDKAETSSNEEHGFFADAMAWKVITGLLVLVLIASIVTQGFRFSEGESSAELSLKEAEGRVVTYVNNYILEPPFTAELQSSIEAKGLYRMKLLVAGQEFDSYVTKDGSLFFPQGFEMNSLPTKNNTVALNDEKSAGEDSLQVPPAQVDQTTEEAVVVNEGNSVPDTVTEPTGKKREVMVDVKKWVFSPSVLTVDKGDEVAITLFPNDLELTFAIPAFGVEKQVKGLTTIKFVAERTGTFEYLCSSCDSWRGMKGSLVVR